MLHRKLRMGMIGGGIGSLIGPVHRMACTLDGNIELVAGCFSSTKERSLQSGKQLLLDPHRVYSDFKIFIEKEAQKEDEEKLDFISIVTPNHLHFEPAKLALESGFHVVCDKPVTLTSKQALELEKLAKNHEKLFMVTHNYTGYPMVKQARKMVTYGEIGKIRKVVVEYPQGWLSALAEKGEHTQQWRSDPKKSGIAGCVGDIGTHAANLTEYICNSTVKLVCADLNAFVSTGKLDDDASILFTLENGAKGILFASQIATGEENDINIRIYGEKASLEWHQIEPNSLIVKWLSSPIQILRTGTNFVSQIATLNSRIPGGHPEGFIEAFANIYRSFTYTLHHHFIAPLDEKKQLTMHDFPTISDGLRGMKFIETVVASSKTDKKWTRVG